VRREYPWCVGLKGDVLLAGRVDYFYYPGLSAGAYTYTADLLTLSRRTALAPSLEPA